MKPLREAVTTLVMHEDNRRVLMARRSSVGAFANALVFPGGVIDEADADVSLSSRYAGVESLDSAERTRRIAGARELAEETGILLSDVSNMRLVSRWITPSAVPTRFDTWFYILPMPEGQAPVADGHELVSLDWVDPREITASSRSNEFNLIFPTLAHLVQLAESGLNWQSLPVQMGDPMRPIEPDVVFDEKGVRYVSIPAESGFKLTRHPL